MSLTILHRLASLICSLPQANFINIIPDPLHQVISIVHTLDLTIIRTRLLALEQKFGTVFLPIWKKRPKRTFKTKMHNLLFLSLQNQDSYADIDNHIYEIQKTPSWNILCIYIIYFHSLPRSASLISLSVVFFCLFLFIYLLPVILYLNLFLFKYLHTCLPRIAFANCR